MTTQPTLPFDAPDPVAEPTDAEQTDAEQTDAEQTDAEQTDAEQTDAEQTDAGSATEAGPALEVRIVRSKRRKKSVGAQIIDGVVEVVVPTWMSKAEAEKYAEQMRVRFERKRGKSHVDLLERARVLAQTYDFPKPVSVRWVTNQNNRWGSCTPADGSIRLSHRLQKTPQWVIDYVLVHELAHLRHPDHSPAFWTAVSRYPKTERARGFLIGISYAENPDEGDY